jgi:hypothetical protein
VLALVQVPEHGDTVLATGGSEGTVGGDGDGVDVTSVAIVVGLQLELGKFPDLMESVSQKISESCMKRKASEILVEKCCLIERRAL